MLILFVLLPDLFQFHIKDDSQHFVCFCLNRHIFKFFAQTILICILTNWMKFNGNPKKFTVLRISQLIPAECFFLFRLEVKYTRVFMFVTNLTLFIHSILFGRYHKAANSVKISSNIWSFLRSNAFSILVWKLGKQERRSFLNGSGAFRANKYWIMWFVRDLREL